MSGEVGAGAERVWRRRLEVEDTAGSIETPVAPGLETAGSGSTVEGPVGTAEAAARARRRGERRTA